MVTPISEGDKEIKQPCQGSPVHLRSRREAPGEALQQRQGPEDHFVLMPKDGGRHRRERVGVMMFNTGEWDWLLHKETWRIPWSHMASRNGMSATS
jgi:hypothetical protein